MSVLRYLADLCLARSNPKPSSGTEKLLVELASKAWRKGTTQPNGNFLMQPSHLDKGTSPAVLQSNLRALYAHARSWAPELSIPFNVPPIKLSGSLASAGQYKVDAGWVSVDVSMKFASSHNALQVILAHEACHHFLDSAGLSLRRNPQLNERMTDLAMFVCGFGEIVRQGRTVVTRSDSGYLKTHLGYLTSGDYDFAYRWVLDARAANDLPGTPGYKRGRSVMAQSFRLTSPLERLNESLVSRIPDRHIRSRTIQFYRKKYSGDSEERIIERIIDHHDRDNR